MRRWISVGIVIVALLVLAWVVSNSSFVARLLLAPGPFDKARLDVPATPNGAGAPASRRQRLFYSGHSLSDGVPAELARIAGSKGQTFDLAMESRPGSLISERAARRRGGFSSGSPAFDTLVVTERHDLPYAARFERTASFLREMHDELIQRDPLAEMFLYQVWLEIDFDDPQRFVDYERSALPFWECVASAVNAELGAEAPAGGGNPKRLIRVLPGAAALAELVAKLMAGEVEGAPGATPEERVKVLFVDRVHPSEAALYYIGAVHYAALFEASPEGAAMPPAISAAFGQSLQRLAWQYTSAYSARARASAARDMALCRDYASQVMCPLFASHPREAEPEHPLLLWRRTRGCRAAYADGSDLDNPFH